MVAPFPPRPYRLQAARGDTTRKTPMADDSFIREVEQELRSDKVKALWDRFGWLIVGGAVLVVALTAAWRGWEYWTERRANASGDRFLAAVEAIEADDRDAARAVLAELQVDGAGRYDLLARLLDASLLGDSDPAAAVAAYRAVADDGDTPPAIADVARVRAAYVLVDSGEPGEVAALVSPLAVEGEPMRHSAREALALASWRADNRGEAAEQFRLIVADPGTPPALRERAETMLALHASLGGNVVEVEPAAAPTDAGATPVEDGAVVETGTPASPAVGLPPATSTTVTTD